MQTINLKGLGEKIYKHKCTNGFEVYMWKYNYTKEVLMTLTVRYGSFHTTFKIGNDKTTVPNGTAHFLEHIKFNEKEGKTAHDFYAKTGARCNAFTTYENTSYEVTTSNNIKENLEHLLYYVYNPYFKEELIEKEKGIIIEESKSSSGNAYSKGYQKVLENLYHKHPRRYYIAGTPEEVKSITLNDVLNVYNNFYLPDNMFLSVCGNINPDEIVEVVENFFKDKAFNKFKAKIVIPKEPLPIVKEYEEVKDNVVKNQLFIAYKYDKKKYIKNDDLLSLAFSRILSINFGSTSDFRDYLINNRIVDSISSTYFIDKNNIIVLFEVSTDDTKKVINLINDKMNHLEIDKKTFIRKTKAFLVHMIRWYDNNYDVTREIMDDVLNNKKIVRNKKDFIRSMKISDVETIIKTLDNTNYTVLEITPN